MFKQKLLTLAIISLLIIKMNNEIKTNETSFCVTHGLMHCKFKLK